MMDNTFQKKNNHLWCYFPAGFVLLRAQNKAPLSLSKQYLQVTAEEGKSEVADLSQVPYFVPLSISKRVQTFIRLFDEWAEDVKSLKAVL